MITRLLTPTPRACIRNHPEVVDQAEKGCSGGAFVQRDEAIPPTSSQVRSLIETICDGPEISPGRDTLWELCAKDVRSPSSRAGPAAPDQVGLEY